MTDRSPKVTTNTRRHFLKRLGHGTLASGLAWSALDREALFAGTETPDGRVVHRKLGKTGLDVSEIGIGGHSWAYKRVPTGNGDFRAPTVDEAVVMIRTAMDRGVNFFDSCTPLVESSTPGEALNRLKARDRVIVSIRVSHKMKGNKQDRQEIYKWTEDRLKLWQTDYVDLCLLCNTEDDTPQSGYWDMSYSLEALDKLRQQGKIRYTGFGCHFTPELFLKAFEEFGDDFDIVSLPYNVRHRAAEEILPAAKEKNLGIVTIKPFARGSLLKKRDLDGVDKGLPRDMLSFVLENPLVDIATCGVHTLEQIEENLSASWTKLTPAARKRLKIAATTPCTGSHYAWLESGWVDGVRYA
jgi:aryl-alcohol dehydrogenase-like predicted oxidoreductase